MNIRKAIQHCKPTALCKELCARRNARGKLADNIFGIGIYDFCYTAIRGVSIHSFKPSKFILVPWALIDLRLIAYDDHFSLLSASSLKCASTLVLNGRIEALVTTNITLYNKFRSI